MARTTTQASRMKAGVDARLVHDAALDDLVWTSRTRVGARVAGYPTVGHADGRGVGRGVGCGVGRGDGSAVLPGLGWHAPVTSTLPHGPFGQNGDSPTPSILVESS